MRAMPQRLAWVARITETQRGEYPPRRARRRRLPQPRPRGGSRPGVEGFDAECKDPRDHVTGRAYRARAGRARARAKGARRAKDQAKGFGRWWRESSI